MEKIRKLNRLRFGVIITFLSLASFIVIFEYATNEHWNTFLKYAGFISIIIFIISLFFTFIKTGLWKFTHKPLKELDEREIALTSKLLRYAYIIYTISVLILLLLYAIIEMPISIILVVALILYAHILPSAVITWTENYYEN